MINDAKDKGRGIFIGDSQWDDCGDIFIGKDSVQSVYMKRIITQAGKPQYDLIWPSASKYLLYATDKYEKNNFIDTLFDSATVEPSTNDIKIYIRSCSRNYGLKYDYKVIVSSDAQRWITVNKQQVGDEGLYIENRGVTSEGVYDSVITISVNPNYNLSSRTASFTIVQYNQDLTVTTTTDQGEVKKKLSPTGKTYSFSIIQKADYIIDTNFDNQEIEWYSDSTYKTRVTSYKDDSLKADMINGLTKLYFKLPGVLTMASGNKSAIRYYGTSYEDRKLTSSDFSINSGASYIKTISNVEYLGDGGWTATINWKDNISTSNYDIRNITHYPSSLTYQKGNGYCTFDLYVGGSSDDRNILITLSMASAASRVVCTQSGGQGEQKLVLDDDSIDKLNVIIEGENGKSNLKKASDSNIEYRSALGHYYFETEWDEEPAQTLLWCTDSMMCEYANYTLKELSQFKYTGTLDVNQGIAFRMYYSEGYHKGSTYKISINYLGVTGQKTVSQLEEKGPYNQIMDLSDINKYGGYENFDRFQVTFKDKFKDVIIVKGSNDDKLLPIYVAGRWYFQLLIPTNAGSEEGIFNITDIVMYNVEDDGYTPKSDGENNFISYKEHNEASKDRAQIAFKINSAAANSDSIEDQMLVALLDTSDNAINNDINVFAIRQGGSNTVGDAKYTTEISPSAISIKNVTDNLNMDAFLDDNGPYSQSKKYYKAYIVCNENKDILKDAEVRTIPKEIVNSSIGTVDNYNNTWIHIQVKGKNVYKGKEREIDVSIQYIGTNAGEAKMTTIYQEANNNVELTDENTPCESLEMSYLSLTDDSQGTIIGADHTSESGWYAVHITLDPNVEVIKKIANLTINNDLYINEGNIVKSSINLPSLVVSKLPILFKYDVAGIPVTRTVTLQIEGIEKTITETWTNIPFTGKIVTRNEYQLDWDATIEYQDGSTQTGWLKVDDNHNLVSSISSSKDDRTASLVITPLEDTKEITFSDNDRPNSSPFKISVIQSAWYDDNNYIMYINDQYKENYVKMSNGSCITIDIPITSYNTKTNTTVGINLELVNTDEEFADVFTYSIDYAPDIVTNGILLSLTCKNPNYSNNNKEYTIKATQTSYVDGQEANAITFTVVQYNYKFELSKEEVKTDIMLSSIINLDYTSVVNGNSWQQIEIYNIPSWLLCSVTQYGITFTQVEENNTKSNRSCTLTLKQKDSNIKHKLKVEDTCYADSEIGVKTIQLYNSNTEKTFTCNSNINEEYANVFCKFTNSTIDEDVVKIDITQGSNDNTKAAITVTNNKTLISSDNYQNNMQYGTLQIYNQNANGTQRMLGTVSVIRNAYKFRNATEDVHSTMTIELSPTKETLYHKYFLESFKNGVLSNKITNNVSTDKIYIYISEDCILYAYPLYDNTTDGDITYNYFLKQEESGLVIDVTFIQHHK